MTIEEWESRVPEGVRGDAVWRRQDYRLAAFAADSSWPDIDTLSAHPGTRELAGQLYRALGSISANIGEGYSRGTSTDRVRFYEYALGSAREAREWYQRGLPLLGAPRISERSALLTSIVRLLLVVIPAERAARSGSRFTQAARRSP